nr:RecName: Full=Endoplasmic reticulum chaperone BiP; AltName: Full=78 kDa glucose-regulated protein; Short=GRP-78; AltName: Full=Binding-immunoglobulin protein; Short=BiP; AltName: Full=Heat shock protein 70 family protein 5; Short=HSP70 family protein 5; AltName: Full=Heat shock protein family A member 5; AltName: Full=Immunoglobulin heavy chain-binding protein [Equus caballus]
EEEDKKEDVGTVVGI